MSFEGGIQLADLWSIARRRAKLMAATALGVLLASYWFAMALPNQYESYATVLVTPQTVDPALVAAGVPESDLNNRLYVMTAQILSRGRLSAIIDKLDLYADESQYMVREEIIDLMRENVGVAPVTPELGQGVGRRAGDDEINQFRISFSHRDAKTAMLVAQQLSNDFIEQHIESRITLSQKSLEFIDDELARLAERIREVEARISRAKKEHVGRLPEDMATTQRQLERLVTDMAFAQRALAEATSDEAFFRSQLNNAPAALGEMTPENRLKTLELQLTEYRAKGFTDKHPDIAKTKSEIETLKQTIARTRTNADGEERPLSYSQQNTEAELRRAVLRKVSAEDEIARLQAGVDELQTLLAQTPAVQEILDGLEREYRHLFDSYQDFSNRQLEAMVQAQLERRQLGEQFRVLEKAFIAPQPNSPNRLLILILGTALAITVGIGVGVLRESIDSSIHSARELQATFAIPVLAAIPQILLEADLAAMRRSRIRAALCAACVIGFALVGGAANYLWVNGVPSFVSGEASEAAPVAGDAAPESAAVGASVDG
ncbi:MAG TPA: Wzz/FepE/Etk N-terminal domain-containing protein [Myxococcota bacterium]|nr:Wzz/FepE/Etk N-terminal domain-containing protein [Myxococcota bacterium]